MENNFDTIILGGGPAGLTAGIYLARGKTKTLILDTAIPGGQMNLTHKISNYPGTADISGYQLASVMKQQALDLGCSIESNCNITAIDLTGPIKTIDTDHAIRYTASSIILATGGRSRLLNVPGEEKLKGRGISYCATCDGDFFQDKKIAVIGGGNTALEEAVSLTKYAQEVTIIHQFDHFQASPHAIEEAKNNKKINFIMESGIASFHGDTKLDSITIKNHQHNTLRKLNFDGAFVFIGYEPNTDPFKNTIQLNNRNEIMVNHNMQTNIPGVFAAGDAIAKKNRQITTAVSDGTNAAISCMEHLHQHQTLFLT